MGLRDKAKQLKDVAAQGAERARHSETLSGLKEAATSGLDRARHSDAVERVDLDSLKHAVTDGAGFSNRSGEIKRWRVAKAVARPTSTGRNALKGAANELVRQQHHRSCTASDVTPSVTEDGMA